MSAAPASPTKAIATAESALAELATRNSFSSATRPGDGSGNAGAGGSGLQRVRGPLKSHQVFSLQTFIDRGEWIVEKIKVNHRIIRGCFTWLSDA
jgi:hypothetical protein